MTSAGIVEVLANADLVIEGHAGPPSLRGASMHPGLAYSCDGRARYVGRRGVAREILRDFPYLEPDDIKAALAYAARQSDHAVLQSV